MFLWLFFCFKSSLSCFSCLAECCNSGLLWTDTADMLQICFTNSGRVISCRYIQQLSAQQNQTLHQRWSFFQNASCLTGVWNREQTAVSTWLCHFSSYLLYNSGQKRDFRFRCMCSTSSHRCKLLCISFYHILRAAFIGLLWVVSVLIDGDWYVCCWNNGSEIHAQLACNDKSDITPEERKIINEYKNYSLVSNSVYVISVCVFLSSCAVIPSDLCFICTNDLNIVMLLCPEAEHGLRVSWNCQFLPDKQTFAEDLLRFCIDQRSATVNAVSISYICTVIFSFDKREQMCDLEVTIQFFLFLIFCGYKIISVASFPGYRPLSAPLCSFSHGLGVVVQVDEVL